MKEVPYYVYIVRCKDETLYTGCTTNLSKRLDVHNSGKGAHYTRARTPVMYVYQEEGIGRSWAQRREYEIKKMTRAQKLSLIQERGLK
ncbi:GIY-YIG nuclease family protein [Thermoactinomyces sp. DSM 45892]|uniref:GIY-YIG nuclease family protein n=1 Tax=Thermoactinomyces sp. DSM 45892 TaxID=1882753 RepID=UPI000B828D85|nr:GIY-YIG nuclease family protein [Thermoactinomyces sp. DSM 45892]